VIIVLSPVFARPMRPDDRGQYETGGASSIRYGPELRGGSLGTTAL
jgi:hypothetical protein